MPTSSRRPIHSSLVLFSLCISILIFYLKSPGRGCYQPWPSFQVVPSPPREFATPFPHSFRELACFFRWINCLSQPWWSASLSQHWLINCFSQPQNHNNDGVLVCQNPLIICHSLQGSQHFGIMGLFYMSQHRGTGRLSHSYAISCSFEAPFSQGVDWERLAPISGLQLLAGTGPIRAACIGLGNWVEQIPFFPLGRYASEMGLRYYRHCLFCSRPILWKKVLFKRESFVRKIKNWSNMGRL